MKHSLLLVAVVALVAFATPAHSQYMYLDCDPLYDGINDVNDVLTPSTTAVDVYVVTNANKDTNPAVCDNGSGGLTINSYEFYLHANGTLTFGSWTDNLGFTAVFGDAQSTTDAYHGRGKLGGLAAGLYKLGRLAISGVGTGATLSIVGPTSVFSGGFTAFGTGCIGLDADNTYKLGLDWFDVDGTGSPITVTPTTWGNIKNIYR